MLSMLVETTEMFPWNPHRLIIAQSLNQQLVKNAGYSTILSLSDPGQALIVITRNFNPLAIFTRWHTSPPSFLPYHTGVFTVVFLRKEYHGIYHHVKGEDIYLL